MFLKVSRVFLAAAVGWLGRDVSGVATTRRRSALTEGKHKVHEKLSLALSERTKMSAASCTSDKCPEWPKDGGHYLVPYTFQGSPFSQQNAAEFKWVVEFFGRFTNLKFVERGKDETGDEKLLVFHETGGCYAREDLWKNRQVYALLAENCMTSGSLSQVLMQAFGFHLEHRRPDRDKYVKVLNVCDARMPTDKMERVGHSTEYDFASVLQLPPSDWYACKNEVSFAAKNETLQPVLEADKMAPSTCDLAALWKRFPGPVAAPTCVANEMPRICEPVDDCKAILGSDEACHEQCKMRCRHNIAPASKKACRLLSVEEIAAGSLTYPTPGSGNQPPASSALRPAPLPAAVLLGGAVGAAFPLFAH